MNKNQFVKFAIAHSDKESLQNLVMSMVDEIPMIREQLFEIFSDSEAGFIVKDDNEKLHLHPRFINNGRSNLNEVSGETGSD